MHHFCFPQNRAANVFVCYVQLFLASPKMRRFVLKRIVLTFAWIGFVIQGVQVSLQYFAFSTSTSVRIDLPENVTKHPLAVCIRFRDIMHREKLLLETGIDLSSSNKIIDRLREEVTVTIANVFDYTPDPKFVIATCLHRPNRLTMRGCGYTACSQLFNVSKFVTQQYVCYIVKELRTTELHFEAATRSTFKTGIIYKIDLNESFSETDIMLPILFRDKLPFHSRDHATQLTYVRDYPETTHEKQKFYSIYVRPADVNIYLLEKPYDTACINKPSQRQDECRLNCLLKGYAPFNRVPGYELLTERYNMTVVNQEDISNPENGSMIADIFDRCRRSCTFRPCADGFTVTQTASQLSSRPLIGISVLVPVDPAIAVFAHPTMTFVEFYSFLCSCFGTWFGVSFMSIVSCKLFRRKQKHRIRKC